MLVILAGCQTEATLESNIPAIAFSLNEDLKPKVRLGNLPVAIDNDLLIARYALQPTGSATEYLMVVRPNQVDGKILLPLGRKNQLNESVISYHGYLNQLLRAHRQILRGDFKDALITLDQLDTKFEYSFGVLVLRANLAYVDGDFEEAQRLYNAAKLIFPISKALVDLEK